MLVATAVAFNAIVELPDALLHVLTSNVGKRVFVAAIAGIALVVIGQVASYASGHVIFI